MPERKNRTTERDNRIRKQNMAQIRSAATRLFARKGYDGTRMTEISELAGLPKANVYYYFGSKARLYAMVLRHLLDHWTTAIENLSAERDPLEAIQAYVRAKLDYSRLNPEESRVFANEVLGGLQRLSPEDLAFMQEVTRRHVAVLEGWMQAGRIRPVHPQHLLISIWATTQYYADFAPIAASVLDRKALRKADFDAAAETFVETILCGLRPERE